MGRLEWAILAPALGHSVGGGDWLRYLDDGTTWKRVYNSNLVPVFRNALWVLCVSLEGLAIETLKHGSRINFFDNQVKISRTGRPLLIARGRLKRSLSSVSGANPRQW